MTQTTYHRISKDDQQEGDFVICNRCNAQLVKYAKIGMEIFGLDCAATILNIEEKEIKAQHLATIKWERRQAYNAHYAAKR